MADADPRPRVSELLADAGLMGMGLDFSDADPVAHCLVGACPWRGRGDSMNDAVTAWTRHLTIDHRDDWPE